MKLSVVLLALLSGITGQVIDPPVDVWTATIGPTSIGNECKLSPGDSLLFCTSNEGSIWAFFPGAPNGSTWRDPSASGTLTSSSGVTFTSSATNGPYVIFASTEDSTSCKVHALSASLDLTALWSSPALTGECSGTPLASDDGNFVFLTHNTASSGTFTVLDAETGEVFYQFNDDVQPFSPPGIYHNPTQGNYVGGEGNTNDILVWANKPMPGEDTIDEATTNAASFAFQFPIGFDGLTNVGVEAIILLNWTNWQAIAPPTIVNQGDSMYWGVSRSNIEGWFGGDRERFDTPGTSRVGYDRASVYNRDWPASQPVWSKMTYSNVGGMEMVFGGTAGFQLAALTGAMEPVWNVTLISRILADPKVSPGGDILWAIEEEGIVHAYSAMNGDEEELLDYAATPSNVVAGYDLTEDGSILYFADEIGIVRGIRVAESAPTPPPTSAPPTTPGPAMAPVAPTTPSPQMAPAAAPVPTAPTSTPITMAPFTMFPVTTQAPVVSTTQAPVVSTTQAPVVSTTQAPVVSTTPAPTRGTSGSFSATGMFALSLAVLIGLLN